MVARIARLAAIVTAAVLAAVLAVAAHTMASAQADTCAVKSRPTGKVLQGYWENWDGAANGVHPPLGWIPITDSRITAHGYNVINAAFPVIEADGTARWEDGMDSTVWVPTPEEICQAKAAGATVLLSIGGATAGIDLNSTAVADRFVATIVPILQKYHFDGIDIDIETGLTGSGDINTLSTSQANLVRIIDGVLAQMRCGCPGLERLRGRAEGPDDLVDQLGRVEGLDLRRQRQSAPGPLTRGTAWSSARGRRARRVQGPRRVGGHLFGGGRQRR